MEQSCFVLIFFFSFLFDKGTFLYILLLVQRCIPHGWRNSKPTHPDKMITLDTTPAQAPTSNPLAGMTGEKWDRMTEHERAAVRDMSAMSPQLSGLEGWRVEVVDSAGESPRRFIVGRSTGWKPCHLEINNRRSFGGCPALSQYASVRRLYFAR